MAQRGEAGRRGPRVRSDCWIGVMLRTTGGVEVRLESKVAAMYGRRICDGIVAGCEALGLTHVLVEVDDRGALPFVLDARLEAAARQAVPDLDRELLPPWNERARYGTERERLRRSRLYLPGNQPKYFLNAGLHGPDGIILDLEDSVAPQEKDAARILVRNALRRVDFHGAERMVRINQGERGLEDLRWIVGHGVQVVLVPKAEDPDQVKAVAARIRELQAAAGGAQEIFLMPIVESALGAWRAYEIAAATDSVVALAIGLEDYTADIGTRRTLEGRESFWARSQVVNGARAAGVQPIDTVFSDVADTEGLRAAVREAKALGFVGKGCIHPRQIAVVHQEFAPTADELAKAERIILAFEEAQARGLCVVSLGSKMIDPPVVKRAQATITMAVAAGMLADNWREQRSEGSEA